MVVCSPSQSMWDITIHPLRGVRGRFPHSYKWWFVLFPSQYGTSQSTPFGASILVDTLSFFQSMWDPPQIHPLWGSAFLLAHRLVSTPFKEQREGWHIVRCLALISFVTTHANPSRYDPLRIAVSLMVLKRVC